jgi:hypothetical protein
MVDLRVTRRFVRLWPVAILFVAGCNADTTHRGTITGRVTLDGRPVEHGSIVFSPIDGVRGIAAGGKILDGQYHLPAVTGPAEGRNRVEIRVARKTGKMIPKGLGTGKTIEEQAEAVAARFNAHSTLTFEVKAGENTADFAVASK